MRYVSIVREVLTRLSFHASNVAPMFSAPLLDGMIIRTSGEWRIDGDADLPRVSVIDLNASESPGKAYGKISLFLSTKNKHGFVKITDSGVNGVFDWMEKLMDAVETAPSTGMPDAMLTPHNEDGTAASTLPCVTLLPSEISWDCKMAEITDLSFTMQLDISFTPTMTRRASRRATPIASIG
jgi:hypothetical protein